MALRRVAVFAGGWRLEAAEAVFGDALRSRSNVLGSLIARSLVVVDMQVDVARFRLLETVRQYAAEKLTAFG